MTNVLYSLIDISIVNEKQFVVILSNYRGRHCEVWALWSGPDRFGTIWVGIPFGTKSIGKL